MRGEGDVFFDVEVGDGGGGGGGAAVRRPAGAGGGRLVADPGWGRLCCLGLACALDDLGVVFVALFGGKSLDPDYAAECVLAEEPAGETTHD